MRKKHSGKVLDQACEEALGQSAYHLRDIKSLLKRPQKQEAFKFMDKHPLIRDMDEYRVFLDMLDPEETRMEIKQ